MISFFSGTVLNPMTGDMETVPVTPEKPKPARKRGLPARKRHPAAPPPKTPPKVRSSFEHGTRATMDTERLRHSRVQSGVSNYADLEEKFADLDESRDRDFNRREQDDSVSDVDLEEEYRPSKEDLVSSGGTSDSEADYDRITEAFRKGRVNCKFINILFYLFSQVKDLIIPIYMKRFCYMSFHFSGVQPPRSVARKAKKSKPPVDTISSMETIAKSLTIDGLGINAPGILNVSLVEEEEESPEFGKFCSK